MNKTTKTALNLSMILCAHRAEDHEGILPTCEIRKAVNDVVNCELMAELTLRQRVDADAVVTEITRIYEAVETGTDTQGVRWNW